MTQRDEVLRFIKDNGSITRSDAAFNLGIYELSARICELKQMGYRFETVTETARNKYGKKISYTRYSLKGAEA